MACGFESHLGYHFKKSMKEKYRKSLNIIWKADLVIAFIFLLTLYNTSDNSLNTEALLGSGFFVLLSAITYTQRCRLDAKEE
jgi:hypothetical protein